MASIAFFAADRTVSSLSVSSDLSAATARGSFNSASESAAVARISQSSSRNAAISGRTARSSFVPPSAPAAARRKSCSLDFRAARSASVARRSPIAPRAVAAAVLAQLAGRIPQDGQQRLHCPRIVEAAQGVGRPGLDVGPLVVQRGNQSLDGADRRFRRA